MAEYTLTDLEDEEFQSPEGHDDLKPDPKPEYYYNTAEVAGASFRQSNSLYQLKKAYDLNRFRPDFTPGIKAVLAIKEKDPDFHLDEQLDSDNIPNEERSFFSGVRNREQYTTAINYYREDKRDKEILENTSTARELAIGLATGLADPINWIPVGRVLKFGTGVVRAAVEGSVISGVNYTARAAANNDFEYTDLALNTVAGGISGAILAGTAKSISSVFKCTTEAIKDSLIFKFDRWFELDGDNLTEVSQCLLGTVKRKASRLIWEIFNATPQFQMMNSGDGFLSKLAPQLFRNRIYSFNGDTLVERSVEENLNLFFGNQLKLSEKVNALRTKWVELKKGTEKEFNLAVSKAIVNDQVPLDSEISESVQSILDFNEKILSEAKKYNVLPEYFGTSGVKTKGNRLAVNQEIANMSDQEFKNSLILNNVELSNETAQRHLYRRYNIDNIYENIDKLRTLINREIQINSKNITDKDLEDVVDSIIAKVTDNNIGSDALGKALIKQREVAIHDDVLLDLGVIDIDPVINHVGKMREVVVETELNRVAVRNGFQSWDELKNSYEEKAIRDIGHTVSKGRAPAETKREVYNYNLSLLNDVESLLKGTFTAKGLFANNRVLKWIADSRGVQFASMAGQLFLSMIPDTAMTVLRNGLGRTFQRLFLPQSTLRKTDKKTLESWLNFLDRAIQKNRFRDLGYVPNNNTLGDWIATQTSKWTGIDYLNQTLKETVAEEVYSNVIHACLENDRKLLNKMGITSKQRKALVKLWNSHGADYKNIYYIDPIHIEDEELNKQLISSIQTVVDQTILTPGAGDVPRFLRSGIGSAIYMFKSYPFMVYDHIFRPLMSGDIAKSRFAQAVAISLTLSGLRSYIKDAINDKETDPTSPDFWKEVVSYSFLDNYIVDAIFTGAEVLKYGDPVNTFPAISWFKNIFRVVRDILIPDRSVNWRQFRNSVPGLNFWWARPFTNPIFPNKKKKRKLTGMYGDIL